MRRPCRIAAAALASAALVVGCGGQSNGQQIRTDVNQFTVDVGQGHAAACKLATGQDRSVLCGLAKAGGPLTSAQCSQVSPSSTAGQACAASQAATAGLSRFTSLTTSKIVVSGSSATVAFNGSSEVMTLTKHNGKWLIASG